MRTREHCLCLTVGSCDGEGKHTKNFYVACDGLARATVLAVGFAACVKELLLGV